MPDGKPWPRISIVTPSYNQGQFIEETIRSVLLQGYPNLEYIVMDGGSTDGTVDILRKYERHIDFWVSEPDKGQAAAINKGFARASSEILAWLNSDDTYQMGVLAQVAELFSQWPGVDVISGRCRLYYKDGREDILDPSPLRTLGDFLMVNSNWVKRRFLIQPEAFFRRLAFDKAGGLRDELYFCLDTCLWMDMAVSGCAFASVDRHWANWRMHEGQKSQGQTDGFAVHARIAWERLRENWARLDNPIAVADDIFCYLDSLLRMEQKVSSNLRESTSYRIGRMLTRWRFW
jgi:glycosyltransferase involved in cell wall biosynthesis